MNEVILTKWNTNGLAAILEVRQENLYRYYCATVTLNVDSKKSPSIEIVPIFDSEINFTISALSGDSRGDQITAIFLQLGLEDGGFALKKGLVFLHPCPQPAVGGDLFVINGKRISRRANDLKQHGIPLIKRDTQ